MTRQTKNKQPSAFEVEKTIESQEGINQQVLDQIPAEFIHGGGGTYIYIYMYFFSIGNEEELPQQGKESSIVYKYKTDDKN